jgi:IS30 family transposase
MKQIDMEIEAVIQFCLNFQKDIGLRELAKEIRCSASTLSRFLRRANIDLSTYRKIRAFFDQYE